jgi:hypothetical protein
MALVNDEEPDWSLRTCVMELLSQVIGGTTQVIGAMKWLAGSWLGITRMRLGGDLMQGTDCFAFRGVGTIRPQSTARAAPAPAAIVAFSTSP